MRQTEGHTNEPVYQTCVVFGLRRTTVFEADPSDFTDISTIVEFQKASNGGGEYDPQEAYNDESKVQFSTLDSPFQQMILHPGQYLILAYPRASCIEAASSGMDFEWRLTDAAGTSLTPLTPAPENFGNSLENTEHYLDMRATVLVISQGSTQVVQFRCNNGNATPSDSRLLADSQLVVRRLGN